MAVCQQCWPRLENKERRTVCHTSLTLSSAVLGGGQPPSPLRFAPNSWPTVCSATLSACSRLVAPFPGPGSFPPSVKTDICFMAPLLLPPCRLELPFLLPIRRLGCL